MPALITDLSALILDVGSSCPRGHQDPPVSAVNIRLGLVMTLTGVFLLADV